MANGVKVKVEGLKELEQSLSQFSKATGTALLKRVLVKAAEPIASAARRMAPVDKGELRNSIEVDAKIATAGKKAFAAARAAGASRSEAAASARAANAANPATAIVRVQATAMHAGWTEYGTAKTAARPFMRPAFRGSRPLHTIKDELRKEIEATAKRVAKRKARKAT